MFRGKVIVAALVAVTCGTSCDADEDAGPPADSSAVETFRPGSSPLPDPSVAATAPTSVATVSTTHQAPESSVTPETVAATTVTTLAEPTVTRPYIADPNVCVAASAREANTADVNDGFLRPFALSSAGWHRFQVIADPNLGVDGRWALVGTIPAKFASHDWNSPESDWYHYDTINGWPVAITTSPTGYADALIDLGGETDAYVRTYRFDLDSIRALISELTLRPPTEPLGFDYSPTDALPGLELVLDRSDEPVTADIAVLECVVEGQSIIRVAAITGDPLAQYVVILDQPYPSDIGRLGETVVSIVDLGRLDRPPRVADVSNARHDVWSRLLEQRPPSQGPIDTGS